MIITKKTRLSRSKYLKDRKDLLTTDRPCFKLVKRLQNKAGRNSSGKITVRHRFAGGRKRLYREVSISRKIMNSPGVVKTIEYDPYRNAFISLVEYKTGDLEYVIHVEGMKVGDVILNSTSRDAQNIDGSSNLLGNMSKGAQACCVAFRPNSMSHMAVAAGCYVTVMDNTHATHTLVKLPSGAQMRIRKNSLAVYGRVSNSGYKNLMLYKAGQTYHKGVRPTVRGKAMNPVDHPHGGGEGNTGTKRHPVSYTGRIAKGGRTLNKRSKYSKYIVARKKKE